MMSKDIEYYNKLSKEYSLEELAQTTHVPEDLTSSERKESDESLRKFRFHLLGAQTENQRLYSDLLRLKYQIITFLDNEDYDGKHSFATYLEEYVRILKKSKKKIAEDLDLHYTRFSRILNEREDPNIELAYRLEEHSSKLIPAVIWWKLVTKKQAFEIENNDEKRALEAHKVKNALVLNPSSLNQEL